VAVLPAQQIFDVGNGARVEGKVRTQGRIAVLVTPFGAAEFPAAEIKAISEQERARLEDEYAAQATAIPAGFANGHGALARWCVEQGLLTHAKRELEISLRLDPVCPPVVALTATLARTYALDPSESGDRGRDRRQLARLLFERYGPRDMATAAIAFHKLDGFAAEEVLNGATDAMRHPQPSARWLGARALAAHRDSPARILPLFRRALIDPEPLVRHEAVRSLKVTNDPVFARLFAKNLDNPKQPLRLAAAEALAELGMPEGIAPLVAALASAGPGATRGHVTVTTQRAYVKDFDVEIAQGAVIADPIVDVVTEGVVLDATVVGISVERGAYRRALRRLSGVDFGTDVKAWESWLEKEGL
jgi:hypothetical protein